MIGVLIGDVVGSAYEACNMLGNSFKSKEFVLFNESSRFTDDTVMTAAVAEAYKAFKKCKCVDEENFKIILVKKMRKFGREYPFVGYGEKFKQWIFSSETKPYGSYGNGSAMRVGPIGKWADTLEEAERMAKASAEVTHNHPEGIKGAQAVAAAVFLCKNGKSKKEIKTYIEKKYYNLDFTLNEIRPDYEFDVSCQGSVPQSIIAFLESTDFEDAIRNAVSLGGDSDTMAAIAGAMAGEYYVIPEDLKKEALKYIQGLDIEKAIYERQKLYFND